MGERALQIGIADPALVGTIAAKVGLSGTASVLVESEADAEKVRRAAAVAGALVDVSVAAVSMIPLPANGVDVVVVHPGGLTKPLHALSGLFDETYRVLRPGGRLVIIEGGGIGFGGRKRGSVLESADSTIASLNAAGFRATRVLAEREGYRFIEGLKLQP